MRALSTIGFVLVLSFGTAGCNNNQAKAEQLGQQLVDSLNSLSDALEKGDKATVKSLFAKMTELAKEAKAIKVTKSQDTAIEAKFKPQMEAAGKRMAESMMKAMTSGKLTQADIMEIQKDAQAFQAAAARSGS